MSDKVQGWAWDLDLQPARKLVLLWLAGRATDDGVAFPGEREIRERTGLGERMVRYHLKWLASDRDDTGQPKRPLVVRVERRITNQRNTSNVYILAVPWRQPDAVRRDLEELQHVTAHAIECAVAQVGATGRPLGSGGNPPPPVREARCPEVGATGCRQESSRRNSHPNTPSVPPMGAQQRQGEVAFAMRNAETQDPGCEQAAQMLAEAFYRGLGADASAVTPPLRRRDLAIARELVAVGSSPSEAEAYAREMSGLEGRLAPIDLRSFERERLAWLVRHRRQERRHVDRTGLPPTWLAEAAPLRAAEALPDGPSTGARMTVVTTPAAGRPDIAGTHLGRGLRAALLAGGC